MKKYFKNIYIVALCIAMLFCLTSCFSIGKSEHTITFYNNKGIYFETNGFGEERIRTQYQDDSIYKVEKCRGEYPSEPTPPTNKGYVFLGWYKNPECTDKFLFGNNKINSDINLYAKWGK